MTPAHREAVRQALLAAVKGRTPEDLGQRTGLHPRTVQRLLQGRTFSWSTVQSLAKVLRVDLDSVRPVERTDAHERATMRNDAHVLSGPIVGWKAAAGILGVSRRHLVDVRTRTGNARPPWWPSRAAVLAWYEGLLLGAGCPCEAT